MVVVVFAAALVGHIEARASQTERVRIYFEWSEPKKAVFGRNVQ